jgi:hypothetical protein
VIERQAIGHAPAPVVPDDREAGDAEVLHDPDHVRGHRALRVRRVVGRARRRPARAIAAQVRADDAEPVGERRGHAVPHELRLGEAVEQEDRRALAAAPDGDGRLARIDERTLEAVERDGVGHDGPKYRS